MIRKVDHAGRINIPSEMCEKYGIDKDDMIEITDEAEFIKIKKFNPEFVCAITGKITDEGQKIGNAFISKEGIKEILNFIEKQEKGSPH